MNIKQIDILNIGLILLSLWIAIKIPFDLFLFSYAVLGPLHYLTEINWLKEKNYFVKSKKIWISIFIFFAAAIAIYPLINLINLSIDTSVKEAILFVSSKINMFLLTGFLFSISLILIKKSSHLFISLVLSFLIATGLYLYLPSWVYIFGLFLPTILHVYLFTLLFMIYGSSKSKSRFGVYGSILMCLVPIGIIFMNIDSSTYTVSESTAAIFDTIKILDVNLEIAKLIGAFEGEKFNAMSVLNLKIQIFIAFSYTYHYLNWFSKTSIIGWKKSLSKKKIALVLFIWVSAVGLYYYDFQTGLIALFFLSFLHVFLEFPLNVTTIKALFLLGRSKP